MTLDHCIKCRLNRVHAEAQSHTELPWFIPIGNRIHTSANATAAAEDTTTWATPGGTRHSGYIWDWSFSQKLLLLLLLHGARSHDLEQGTPHSTHGALNYTAARTQQPEPMSRRLQRGSRIDNSERYGRGVQLLFTQASTLGRTSHTLAVMLEVTSTPPSMALLSASSSGAPPPAAAFSASRSRLASSSKVCSKQKILI